MEHKLIQTPNVKNRTAGVYQIRNTLDGKVYIGSSVNIKKRLQTHRYELKKGIHCSKHMQAAWNKHGGDSFTFDTLLVCGKENLILYEQTICDGMKANNRDHGYNKLILVDSHKGMKLTKEQKKARSLVLPHGPAHHNYGKDWGAIGREALALSKKNCHPLTDAHKANLAASKRGKKMPEGFSEIMRQARLGKTMSEETKRRKANARKNMSFQKAEEIRKASCDGIFLVARLAENFGVSKKVVRSVLAGTTWAADCGT